jgi:hypothetical protein
MTLSFPVKVEGNMGKLAGVGDVTARRWFGGGLSTGRLSAALLEVTLIKDFQKKKTEDQ